MGFDYAKELERRAFIDQVVEYAKTMGAELLEVDADSRLVLANWKREPDNQQEYVSWLVEPSYQCTVAFTIGRYYGGDWDWALSDYKQRQVIRP
jgi:hypothetical protein